MTHHVKIRNSYKPLEYKRLSPPIVTLLCNNSVTLVTHLARLKPKSDLWIFEHFEIGHFNKIKPKKRQKSRNGFSFKAGSNFLNLRLLEMEIILEQFQNGLYQYTTCILIELWKGVFDDVRTNYMQWSSLKQV